MSTTVNLPNGTLLTVIPDGGLDTSTSLTLIGANAAGFAESFNENLVRLLVNSASPTAPLNPLDGQLWLCTSNPAQPILYYSYQGLWVQIDSASVNLAQQTLDTANSVLDAANQTLSSVNSSAASLINQAFANAQAEALSIINVAESNFGSAQGFINSVLASANAAATLAANAALTAQTDIAEAIANALSSANGALIATYVSQASNSANTAAGYAAEAQTQVGLAAGYATQAYNAESNVESITSNAIDAEASAASYSAQAANSASLAGNSANAASIYVSEAATYASNASQEAFSARTAANDANTAASNASVLATQAAAASNSANAASAAAYQGALLAANAAANASTYQAQALAASNTAVGASSNAIAAQAAAYSIYLLSIGAENAASNSAANAAILATQAENAFANANIAASEASTYSGLATNAATNASNSANSSIQQASYAASYASNAAQYANSATASALQANTAASSAQSYSYTSLNAANSATGAAASATAAAVLAASVQYTATSVLPNSPDFQLWANASTANTFTYTNYYDWDYNNPNTPTSANTISIVPYGITPLNLHYISRYSQFNIANCVRISTNRSASIYWTDLGTYPNNIFPVNPNNTTIANTVTWGFTSQTQNIAPGWYVIEANVSFNQADTTSTSARPEQYSGVVVKSVNANGATVYQTLNFWTTPDMSGLTPSQYQLLPPYNANAVWSGNVPSSYGNAPVTSLSITGGADIFWYKTPTHNLYMQSYAFEAPRKYNQLIYIPPGPTDVAGSYAYSGDGSVPVTVYACMYSPFFANAKTDPAATATANSITSNGVSVVGREMLWTHLALRPASAAEVAGNSANAAIPVIQSQIVNFENAVATNNATFATQLSGLTSQYNSANAAILNLETTFASANAASASQYNTLQASIANTNANVATISNVVTTANAATASTLYTLQVGLNSTNANVSTLANAFATANSSTAQQIQSISASIISNTSSSILNLNPYFSNWNTTPFEVSNTKANALTTPISWNIHFANVSTPNTFYGPPSNYTFYNVAYTLSGSGLETAMNPPNGNGVVATYVGNNITTPNGGSSYLATAPYNYCGFNGGYNLSASQILTPGYYIIETSVSFDTSSDSRWGAGLYLHGDESVGIHFATDPDVTGVVAPPTTFGPAVYYTSTPIANGTPLRTSPAIPNTANIWEEFRTYSKLVYANSVAILSACLYNPILYLGVNTVAQPGQAGVGPLPPPANFSRSIMWNYVTIRRASAAELAGSNANSAIPGINNSITSISASITNISNVIVTSNSATATQLSTLTAEINNTNSTVSTQGTAIALLNGYASAAYTLNLNANGVVTGYKAFAGSNGVSSFQVLASDFIVADPNSNSKTTPLTYANGTLTIGNCVVDGNLIVSGSIVTNSLANNSVTNTLIATANGAVNNNSLTTILSITVNLTNAANVVCQAYGYANDGGGNSSSSHNTTIQINADGNYLCQNKVSGNPWAVDQALFTTGSIPLSAGSHTIDFQGSTANNDTITQRFLLVQWFYK